MGKIKMTEARKRATEKYHAKLDRLCMRFPLGSKDRWKAAADASGMSLTKFIEMCVEKEISKTETAGKTEN